MNKCTIFKINDRVQILSKVFGLKKFHLGTIVNINGEYHDVLPDGRKKNEIVELYRNEIRGIQ